MGESDICKLKFSSKINKKAPVFLTDFYNGRLNLDNEQLKFQCLKSTEDSEVVNNVAKRILLANNGRINYSASSFDPDSDVRNSPLRYLVGVRDKTTGKMKMYDSVFFHMKPIMKPPKVVTDTSSKKSFREGVDDLTSSFGSKKKRRDMNSRLKHVVVTDELETIPLEDSDLQDFVSSTSKNNSSAVQNAPISVGYIPSHNPDATTVNEVYDINNIITPEENTALTSEAEVFLNLKEDCIANWKSNNRICKYVASHLLRGDDEEKAKYLIYYNYLVLFVNLHYTEIRKINAATSIPEPFRSKMLSNFTNFSCSEAGRRTRTFSLQLKDKLLSHLLVLALFIDDFSVDTSLVQSDLKMGISTVVKVAQALGCRIASRKVEDHLVKFAELKLPLTFPLPRFKKKSYS